MFRSEMLRMDKAHAIRHSVLVLGKSRRWTAREFKVSRRTVDRYVDGEVEPGRRKPSARASPVREAAAAALERLVEETKVAKKQKLTAMRALELLKSRGVSVGYTLVKELMAERRRAAAEVYVPLTYRPGELAEVDFFEVEVEVDGEQETAYLFVMRLMSSGRDFVRLYPRQDGVCFLDGHVRAFAHLGVPARIAYDNLKAAVKRHLVGSERELNPRFLSLTTFYAFEACFCRPYQGHDKGGVEARGKHIRWQSMVPVPEGLTLDELSRGLLADVERRFFARPGAEAKWAAERDALRPPPARAFDVRMTRPSVPVSSCSTVTVERATYSVPSTWARRTVSVHVGVDVIDIVGPRGEAIQRRRLRRGERDIDYAEHYLDVLSKKPQALRQVADELMAQLGGPFPAWWDALVDERGPRDAARQMARILHAVGELGRDEAERRVARAFETGEALSTCLLVENSGEEPPPLVVPPALDIDVETSTVAHFDELLGGAP